MKSRDQNEKVDACINRTNPHLWKVSRTEQPGGGAKSLFMTMMDHSTITMLLYKDENPEPTSIRIRGFTGGQPPEGTVIELPANGPESAQDALDRIYESCRQHLKERQHFLTFEPTTAQLEYLARVENPTVSVIARLTRQEYLAMPGVESVQEEMARRMKEMLERYNTENRTPNSGESRTPTVSRWNRSPVCSKSSRSAGSPTGKSLRRGKKPR